MGEQGDGEGEGLGHGEDGQERVEGGDEEGAGSEAEGEGGLDEGETNGSGRDEHQQLVHRLIQTRKRQQSPLAAPTRLLALPFAVPLNTLPHPLPCSVL